MKYFVILSAACFLVLLGCEYEAPISDKQNIAVDSAVLGLWELLPEKDEKQYIPERMMVLKYTDTEYLIQYPAGKDSLYFRGYPIKVGDISCVQLQLIGTAEGNIKEDDRDFQVVSYSFAEGELMIKILNTNVVKTDLKDSESLKKAFIQNQDNGNLFIDPGKFIKVINKT